MKILLTGCAGQLGRELKRSLACLGEVIACDRSQLDLARADPLRAALRSIAPAVIINAKTAIKTIYLQFSRYLAIGLLGANVSAALN